MGRAPERFSEWMSTHTANDNKHGRRVYRYHPRSDEHSKALCRMVMDDLLDTCPLLRAHARDRIVVGGVNSRFSFANGKVKNLDLAIGLPAVRAEETDPSELMSTGRIASLRIALEAKQCMTEHSKTKPRIFDELSSSHEIVHQGDPTAIAAGIVVVNIADQFVSPLRQESDGPVSYTRHRQPEVAESMVRHLRGLKLRAGAGEVGFDAFAIIVVDCNNIGACKLHSGPPAPQPGDPDHYVTFLQRIGAAYAARHS